MIRKFAFGIGLAFACGLGIGCGGSSSTSVTGTKPSGDAKVAPITIDNVKDMAGDAASKGKEKMAEGLAKGKEELLKALGVGEEMTKTVDTKISALSGDAKVTAQTKYDDLKKLLVEFKNSPTLDGWKDKLTTAVDAVKKAVGL